LRGAALCEDVPKGFLHATGTLTHFAVYTRGSVRQAEVCCGERRYYSPESKLAHWNSGWESREKMKCALCCRLPQERSPLSPTSGRARACDVSAAASLSVSVSVAQYTTHIASPDCRILRTGTATHSWLHARRDIGRADSGSFGEGLVPRLYAFLCEPRNALWRGVALQLPPSAT